ncbi:MAG TPA: YcxB family protein [Candidatus Acidoferrum sp.]|nr:YcxB family protein [Candidatus Acidoferrum sp.]
MTLRCNLTEADYRAFKRHIERRYEKAPWIYAGIALLFSALLWIGDKSGESVRDKIERVIGVLGLTAVVLLIASPIVWMFMWLFRRLTRRRWHGWIGERVYDISAEGVRVSSKNGRIETPVSAIWRLDETRRHFFIITRGGWGHIIPKRDLSDPQPLRELQLRVQANIALEPTATAP